MDQDKFDDYNHEHCSCGHDHTHEDINLEDFICDIDPNKICDNCMKCLNSYNTDKEGFVQIKIDNVDTSKTTLEDLYKLYGLDDEEE